LVKIIGFNVLHLYLASPLGITPLEIFATRKLQFLCYVCTTFCLILAYI